MVSMNIHGVVSAIQRTVHHSDFSVQRITIKDDDGGVFELTLFGAVGMAVGVELMEDEDHRKVEMIPVGEATEVAA